MKHSHFPFFLPCRNKTFLVVGGGTIATRRILSLTAFDFNIKVVTLTATPTLHQQAEAEKISLFLREVEETDWNQVDFCLLCTDKPEINETLGAEAKKRGILCNQCHNKNLSDFYFPAIVETQDMTIGLVGDGTQHKKVAHLRKILEQEKNHL